MSHWHSPPPELYALVEQTPGALLLECAGPAAAPWTRVFTTPIRILTANEPAEIARLFAEIESAVAAGNFAAGFFAYECGLCFEPTTKLRRDSATPLAWVGIYDHCYQFDHWAGAFIGGDPPELAEFAASIGDEHSAPFEAVFDLDETQYAERIAAIHEWIRSGDVYQLNFTAPLRVNSTAAPAAFYRRLRDRQPVPYGAFFHWQPGHHILSFSPELFFRVDQYGDGRRITTRPMKGTAPRGRSSQEDRAQALWLKNDVKNRAENVMIVDLLRNDLGRLCRFGSVQAESLFAVERYPTLWQMTSTVSGELRPEIGFREIFRALFPCGSVTGAPKVRAMQLLTQLEQEPRGVYTGALGFFSRDETVFNVAIRTLELDGGNGKMGVGSGIVADSDAADEFRECTLKAEFLTRTSEPPQFSLVETLLWHDDSFARIELHLDRLVDSAEYFDFVCDRTEVRTRLLAEAVTFRDQNSRKIRLLLDRDGRLHITNECLPELARDAKPIRVRIAIERTDPRDAMLFHKTTHRPLYAEAFKAATAANFDEVLFVNLRGEVTEGAISNIFVEKNGRWFTPPIECGLLAGVERRHLIATRSDIEERILHLEDLREADAIYLTNAVRGLRRAGIDWQAS
jgi:para-aminobenzoate synthetase/4-amino-4-deoxychorismate lyase